jgi:GNAT superfamily N-acetyltransferase
MDAENLSGLVVGRADASDWAALAEIDSVAAAGDLARRDSIRRWCAYGLVIQAEDSSGPLGYSVLEYTFFEQGFVTMLMVAPSARRRGVGTRLLQAVEAACTTPKLFTSTNVSNHPMRQLLQRAGWSPVGPLHGLDEGDPELFHLCPNPRVLRDEPFITDEETVDLGGPVTKDDIRAAVAGGCQERESRDEARRNLDLLKEIEDWPAESGPSVEDVLAARDASR